MKKIWKTIKTFAINFWNAENDVKIRCISLIIALINLVLYLAGKNQITVEAEIVWRYITSIVTVIVALVSAWKNNDITPIAKKYTAAMRAEKASVYDEVENDEYVTEDEGTTEVEIETEG